MVNPNWLTDIRDQEVAVAAFKQARAVFMTNVTKAVLVGAEAFPGLNVSSDAQILNLIQQSASASYHASATCAMGKANDTMAVLDSKARVYGVEGLRVVDASAFPVLPPGHPSSTICKLHDILLRGRCGEMLKKVHSYLLLTFVLGIDALAEKIADDIINGA